MGGTDARERGTGEEDSSPTVLVADRGRAFAEALAGLLAKAGLDATAAAYGDAAMTCLRLRPATVLLDGDAPVAGAAAIAEAARSARSDVCVLLLVGDGARGHARAVAEVGARGVVSRQSAPEDVIAAVCGGAAVLPSGTARTATRRARNGDPLDRLTHREVQVLRAIMAGASSTAIAGALGISPHTVRSHIQNTFAKLAVSTRLEAASLAREEGLRPLSLDGFHEAARGSRS